MKAVLQGVGSFLPDVCVTNHELAKRLDTSDEWITSRTGIKQRYIAPDGTTTSTIAIEAAKQALKDANVNAKDIDLIILATSTPDHAFPATATRIQYVLGCIGAYAFDVQAACSGFVYALQLANMHITSGQRKCVLVIGAETMSHIIDWQNRATCVLFGDGGGAFVLTAEESKATQAGIMSCHLHSDGSLYDSLYVKRSQNNARGCITMNGSEIFKQAVNKIGASIFEALTCHNLSPQDVDWFVPHQANARIIKGIANHFKLPLEQFVTTIDIHANTSAASIPLAYDVAKKDGRIKPNQLVVLEAMGAGLTWGSVILRT